MPDSKIISTPLPEGDVVLGQIAELQEKLKIGAPGYEKLLQVIHTNLRKDPNLVHLLDDEQIGVIVEGLSKYKNIVIATTIAKSRKPGKSAKDITINDL